MGPNSSLRTSNSIQQFPVETPIRFFKKVAADVIHGVL